MLAPEPLVSIGLPVRNGERYLGEAVRSVLDQEYGRLELVISDNASDDGTEEICREFARSDARVRYHRQSQNIGLVANFNAVLHLATGTYFKWMGDDDWLTPTYVSAVRGGPRRRPRADPRHHPAGPRRPGRSRGVGQL